VIIFFKSALLGKYNLYSFAKIILFFAECLHHGIPSIFTTNEANGWTLFCCARQEAVMEQTVNKIINPSIVKRIYLP
jgi:hypothetical protein